MLEYQETPEQTRFVMAVNPLFDVDGVVPLMCPCSEKKEQSFITSRRSTRVLEGKG